MDDLIGRLAKIRSNYDCFNESEEPYYRALSEAIKKLSERTDGDIISRQEAIKELEELNAISFYELNEHSREAYREIKQMLKELPPAQPERKKGKWTVYYECPKCGEITKDFTEYCPFCGADMRGERNED